jgi:hypothetical protein
MPRNEHSRTRNGPAGQRQKENHEPCRHPATKKSSQIPEPGSQKKAEKINDLSLDRKRFRCIMEHVNNDYHTLSNAVPGSVCSLEVAPMNPKLKPCPDCGHQISKTAAKCPNCGRDLNFGQQVAIGAALGILALIIIGLLLIGAAVLFNN